MNPQQPPPDAPVLPADFAYSRLSRVLAGLLTLALAAPLVLMLVFLVSNPPSREDVGPVLIALLFFLLPPMLVWLRQSRRFWRYQVQPQRLVAISLGRRWELEWRRIAAVVRRDHHTALLGGSFRVRIKVIHARGEEWIDLFDSAMPQAEAFYSQLLAHTPHIRPKELEDAAPWFRRWL